MYLHTRLLSNCNIIIAMLRLDPTWDWAHYPISQQWSDKDGLEFQRWGLFVKLLEYLSLASSEVAESFDASRSFSTPRCFCCWAVPLADNQRWCYWTCSTLQLQRWLSCGVGAKSAASDIDKHGNSGEPWISSEHESGGGGCRRSHGC